ncbi:HD domain-containing protein [Thermodesulfobacteriota bacterium]
MKPKDLESFKIWFTDYVSEYLTDDSDYNYAIRLKEDHTHRVCRNIALLGKELNLSDQDMLLAETMALFHDIGRFKQYERYRTFNDSRSENHADLGLTEIAGQAVLSVCTQQERYLITNAIAFHNAVALPEDRDDKALFFMRLLRDADKLDIWKVFCDYYHKRQTQPDAGPNATIELGLPDKPACSPDVIGALQEGRFARVEDLRTLNDFKLLQISWVFDLNFIPSFQALQRRRHIEQIAATLPQTGEIPEVVKRAHEHINTFSKQTGSLNSAVFPVTAGRSLCNNISKRNN